MARGRYRAPRRLAVAPPLLLAGLYAGLTLVGFALLATPWAQARPIPPGDALFTAVSAATVTGLGVIDVGRDLTGFGQGVVLALIQIGGLGLMTVATLVIAAFGAPIGHGQQTLLKEDLSRTSLRDLGGLCTAVIRVVTVCEGVGTVALATAFVPDLGWREGLWAALFHAVSAFNNAGFSLFPDSLTRWAAAPVAIGVVSALVIVGGLGHAVIVDLMRRRGWRALELHSKLMLAGTAALLLWATVAFAALEWRNDATLGALDGPAERLMASWFHAVMARTAGFNAVDIGATHDATAMLLISQMLVGAGSGSTAGGIKVTTFIVLILATIAFLRRRETMRAFGRSLGPDIAFKALALTTISLLTVMAAIFLTTITHEGDFLDLAFEAASAFGTVGLSRGATAELDGLGRGVIMGLMFLGRVGPLTLGVLLATRAPSRIGYPRGRVYLG